jgi:DNA polymerase III subunit alpha
MFGDTEETEVQDPPMPDVAPWSRIEQLKKEKEIAGFYLSGHPMDDFKLELDNFCNIEIEQLNDDLKSLRGRELKFAGIISVVSHRTTKTGKPMGSFTIEDYNGSTNMALFSDDYLKFKHFLIEGASVYVKATVRNRYNSDDQFEIKINHITLLVEVIEHYASKIFMKLPLNQVNPHFIDELKAKIKKNKGKCKLQIELTDTDEKKSIMFFARNTGVDAASFTKAFSDNKEIGFKLE